MIDEKLIIDTVLHQLRNYWTDINENIVVEAIPQTLELINESFYGLPSKRYFNDGSIVFSTYVSVQWGIFLYRLSNAIWKNWGGTPVEADQVYYLNKIMHSNDWFYQIELPVHFLCEHPLGSVLGKADYSDYLFVYQGTTVGGNRKADKLYYPTIGKNVILFANSTVLGNSHIGSNVVISADTYIINQDIPDNCIVFGKSPDLIIKNKTEDEIKNLTKHIWGWR